MTSSTALEPVSAKDEALGSALGTLSPRRAGRPCGPPVISEVVTASHVLPARRAVYGTFPDLVDDRLRTVLAEGGIEQPYVHQSEAIDHALAGRHVVVVTPTASGKTLCYNVPVLSTILAEPTARALYLFPTKALAQDQLAELHQLADRLKALGEEISTFTYDGDTPQDARRAIRGRAHVVLSNPEMLHSGILPHHPRWAKLFENLRYVVIDELHAYRSVFGSHLANVLRRLKRICQHYRSVPVFICSSATIANPQELAQHLIEEDFALVDRSGAPRGEKWFVIVNPPVVNQQLGIRRSYVAETRRLALECLRRQLQVIVFAQSRLTTEVLTTYLKDSSRALPGGADAIRGYRGGYLPQRRREIERGLRAGTVRGVVSTNALELGIDIGSLDVSIMAGYPGTIAGTWQRAGRAGRRASRSAAVLIASSAPIDQFVAQHPTFFFDASPEHALVNPNNLQLLVDHIKCAAFELPFTADERFGHGTDETDVQSVLGVLAEEGFVHHAEGQWYWVHESYPADAISLRSISFDNFVVIDQSDRTTVIGEVGFSSALSTLHEKAIYIVEGRQYQVDSLDFEGRRAYVSEVDCDYYTDAISYTKVTILESFGRDEIGGRTHGEVHVVSRVVGFKKIKFYTNENVGSGELDLPEQQMHTTAYWLTVPRLIYAASPFPMAERRDGVAGLGIALRSVAQLLLMCERHDIGLAIHGDEERKADGSWGPGDAGGDLGDVSDEPFSSTTAILAGSDSASHSSVFTTSFCLVRASWYLRADANTDARHVLVRSGLPDLKRRGLPFTSSTRSSRGWRSADESCGPRTADRGRVRASASCDRFTPDRDRSGRASGRPHDVFGLLGGALEAGAEGSCCLIQRKYEPGHLYGTKRICVYPEPSFDALDLLAGCAGCRVPSERLRRAICLDLETTGLSGGAGTVGFIVGLGWFDSGTFHTCQYFLSSPAHERSMLTGVATLLRRACAIITFNGRSFDGPVMETRYAFHGLPSPLEGIQHVDLLHPSRHLWMADDGRLVSLDRNVLGLRRVGDVSGGEIPGRYVGYLRSGDPGPLVPVLEHNRLDLVSLGALAGLACELVRDGARGTQGSAQALGLGRVFERAGRCERAVACYRRAAALDQSDGRADPAWVPPATSGNAARALALGRLARIYRRQRRHADDADAWVRLLRLSRIPDRLRHETSLALAVHHEHRVRDLRTAQQFAVRTLEADLPAIRRQAVHHRLLRLRRKIEATRTPCEEKPLLQPTSHVTSTA